MTILLRLLTAALACLCAGALLAPAAGAWPPRSEAGSIRLPERTDLGQQRVGTARSVDVSFVASPTDMLLTGVGIGGPDARDFRVTPLRGGPGRGLISFVRETFRVEFRPSSLGPKRARLVVSMTGGPPRATFTQLSGTGVGPSAALAPGSLDFPPTAAGARSEPQLATLTNTGVDPVTITRLRVRGRFSIEACGRLPHRIAPGGHCDVAVRFLPRGVGEAAGSLTVYDTAPGHQRRVALTGTGVSSAPPPAVAIRAPAPGGPIAPGVTLRGTLEHAGDEVGAVEVALVRERPARGDRCVALDGAAGLVTTSSCARLPYAAATVDGTDWTYEIPAAARLAPGAWVALVRALDGAGDELRPASRRYEAAGR